MSSGDASLDRHLARLAALGAMHRSAVPAVARAVERVTASQIARGVDPSGKPWPLTKTGEKPLEGALGAVTVRPVDGAVVITVDGPEGLHHAGKARGHVVRQIIPSGSLPSPMSSAIADAVDVEFRKIMGAR